ncbi:MAG: hypothetical protein BMS9Abin07_2367 [Acidimicrobiia bacterium]|nr:MAG: hypothetical protein BMS9Abin07_2367 [Acidimicrobiia bacterium]
MSAVDVGAALDAAEAALDSTGPVVLRGTGFWRAVATVKRQPSLVADYADRIGAIDQAAFRSRVPLLVPFWPGTVLAVLGTAAGLALIGVAYGVEEPWNGIWFLLGTGALLGATHGLAHLAVGAVFGIHFTVWFAGFRRPQPGIKTDYASYLRTPARRRAWMHAAGAIVTKAIPFLLVPPALIAGVPTWTVIVLVGLGVFQLITDALWSTKVSDWAKYRREMAMAREYEGT